MIMPKETIELMVNTMRRLRTIYDRLAAQHGLTLARVRVLLRLGDREGMTQQELAQVLQIEAPTLKRQIDALVAAGFIERRFVSGEGRAQPLFLTEFAKAHSVTEFSKTVRNRLLEGVSPEELEIFQSVLNRINRNLDEIEEE